MYELKQMRGIDMSLFNECFYTDDFDQEMIDYVDTLGNFTARCYIGRYSGWSYLKYGTANNYFWASNATPTSEYKYLTKQQFKERIGMTQKQFTKSDLKTGMVVKHRGGCCYSNKYGGLNLVVKDSFIQADEFCLICNYNQDLTSEDFTELDIVEVFEVLQSQYNLKNITSWKLKSIWKREEKLEVPSPEQIEIEKIQAEMQQLNKRLGELKAKV